MVKLAIVVPSLIPYWRYPTFDVIGNFNKVFLSPPYYAVMVNVADFCSGGGELLALDAEMKVFQLCTQYGVDVVLALDYIDFTNDPADARTQLIGTIGCTTWQEALHKVCAELVKHSCIKYVIHYAEYTKFSADAIADTQEFVNIVNQYPPLIGGDWRSGERAAANVPYLRRDDYPYADLHGIKDEEGTSWITLTNCITGEEAYEVGYLSAEDCLWNTRINNWYRKPTELCFGMAFDFWDRDWWISEEELDRIFRLSTTYLQAHPEVDVKYLGIGSGNLYESKDQVWRRNNYCGKYTDEMYRVEEVFGIPTGPIRSQAIINAIDKVATDYNIEKGDEVMKIINNGLTDITVVEILKQTTLASGEEVDIDATTTIIELK